MPGLPHHVVQRGARRLQTFFGAGDYRRYLLGLRGEAERWDLSVWAYCLMPNHVHLVVVPSRPDGLSAPVGEAHRRYAWLINRRQGWNGHLWQERFSSFPMDAEHLCLAVRYVLLNPVRAGLVREAWDWPYSSVTAHLGQGRDPLVDPAPLAQRIEDWRGYLRPGPLPAAEILRRHARSGLPLGSESFVAGLERLLDRPLRPLQRGRPPGPAKG